MEYFLNFEKMAYIKGSRPAGCILCLIKEGAEEVVNLTVHTGKNLTICVNLYPYNPGHVMIFPHRHITDIREYTQDEAGELHELTQATLDVLDKTHGPAGYNIGYNMGGAAGGSIDHLHRHVIPRYPRETGISDLIAGKRVLVESPFRTTERLKEAFLSRFSGK